LYAIYNPHTKTFSPGHPQHQVAQMLHHHAEEIQERRRRSKSMGNLWDTHGVNGIVWRKSWENPRYMILQTSQ
jgi:hypothetical protein